MSGVLSGPWPWYVAGPLIGLFVPALLPVRRGVGAYRCVPGAIVRAHGGKSIYLVAALSALAGTWLYGYLRPHLPHY